MALSKIGTSSLQDSIGISGASITGSFTLTGDVVQVSEGGTGSSTGINALIALGERTSATGSVKITAGTTAQRDTPAAGHFRFNTDESTFEGYNGTAWGEVGGGGGATGGGDDAVFTENDQAVTSNYEITAGKNAITAGPITINSGISATVPSGSVWTIV
jgi:hypothetical protein